MEAVTRRTRRDRYKKVTPRVIILPDDPNQSGRLDDYGPEDWVHAAALCGDLETLRQRLHASLGKQEPPGPACTESGG